MQGESVSKHLTQINYLHLRLFALDLDSRPIQETLGTCLSTFTKPGFKPSGHVPFFATIITAHGAGPAYMIWLTKRGVYKLGGNGHK